MHGMQSTKTEILESALQLFSKFGYEGTSVQQVCEAAGITKPSLYHYFGSKRGLLEALLQSKMSAWTAGLQKAAAYRNDITFNIHELIRFTLNFVLQEPLSFRLYLNLGFAPIKSEAYLVYEPWAKTESALLLALFNSAAEDHGNMRGRESYYALSLLGTIRSYGLELLNGGIKADEALIYRVQHQFMHGIFS